MQPAKITQGFITGAHFLHPSFHVLPSDAKKTHMGKMFSREPLSCIKFKQHWRKILFNKGQEPKIHSTCFSLMDHDNTFDARIVNT